MYLAIHEVAAANRLLLQFPKDLAVAMSRVQVGQKDGRVLSYLYYINPDDNSINVYRQNRNDVDERDPTDKGIPYETSSIIMREDQKEDSTRQPVAHKDSPQLAAIAWFEDTNKNGNKTKTNYVRYFTSRSDF